MKIRSLILLLFFISPASWSYYGLTDDQIRQLIIEGSINEFIERYPNSCVCPYSLGLTGKACGNDSAYYQGTGFVVLRCYPRDVTEGEIIQYRLDYGVPVRERPGGVVPAEREF